MPPELGTANSVEVRLAVLEKLLIAQDDRLTLQIGRILADIESEKGTRLRLHGDWQNEVDKMNRRLSSLETRVNMGIGAIMTLQVVVPIVLKFWHP